jgi:hypothetical protein
VNYRTGKIVEKIMKDIKTYEDYLDFLNDKDYTDKFDVVYRKKIFTVENEVLRSVLIDYYVNKAKGLHKKLHDIGRRGKKDGQE